jgi:hypothetical protein
VIRFELPKRVIASKQHPKRRPLYRIPQDGKGLLELFNSSEIPRLMIFVTIFTLEG